MINQLGNMTLVTKETEKECCKEVVDEENNNPTSNNNSERCSIEVTTGNNKPSNKRYYLAKLNKQIDHLSRTNYCPMGEKQ